MTLEWSDTYYTDEVICPCCGYVYEDSWEIGRGEDIGNIKCCECGETFFAERNYEVSYTTYKIVEN